MLTSYYISGGNYANTTPTDKEKIGHAKHLMGESTPYRTEKIATRETIVIFNAHFLRMLRQALSNGCTEGMSKSESELFFQFIGYQDGGVLDFDPVQDSGNILIALDKWIVAQVNCQSTDSDDVNRCTGDEHTWKKCPSS
jgi:hypothetical protein